MNNDIIIDNLSVSFFTNKGMVNAVDKVSTVLEGGKITGLIGESGSGKSVLGMSLLQLLPLEAKVEGCCEYNGYNLISADKKLIQSIRGKEIALIPQNPSEALNSVRRIKKQLTETITVHEKKSYNAACKRAADLLIRFGFKDPDEVGRKYSFQLSGGMNQRVISVLGLMCEPKWVIADEPTKGLDSILRKQVYGILKSIVERDTGSMILITHDITLAKKLCDNIMVMYEGRVLEQGKADIILKSPQHPYTKGLLESTPDRGMHPIQAVMPKREGNKSGCNFYPRCLRAIDICEKEKPQEYIGMHGQKVRCFLCQK